MKILVSEEGFSFPPYSVERAERLRGLQEGSNPNKCQF